MSRFKSMEKVRQRIREIEPLGRRYFHGTTTLFFQNAFDQEKGELDMSKYGRYDNRFYFFRRLPPFDSMMLFPTGKIGAAHHAIRKAKENNGAPLIISGVLDRSLKIERSYGVGHYVKTDAVPVDTVYLGKTRGLAWSLDGHFFLPPGSFKKMGIEEYLEFVGQ